MYTLVIQSPSHHCEKSDNLQYTQNVCVYWRLSGSATELLCTHTHTHIHACIHILFKLVDGEKVTESNISLSSGVVSVEGDLVRQKILEPQTGDKEGCKNHYEHELTGGREKGGGERGKGEGGREGGGERGRGREREGDGRRERGGREGGDGWLTQWFRQFDYQYNTMATSKVAIPHSSHTYTSSRRSLSSIAASPCS